MRVIIDMVHHTRLGTIAGTLGIMRAALAEAVWWCAHRTAFQKRLIDQPAMAGVLGDLALDYEAAAALVMHVARAFDAQDEDGRAYARLAVAVAKFQLTKRCAQFVYECMEAHGGVGYCEDTPLPPPVPRKPAQRDLGGLGQCHRARHPAHPEEGAAGARRPAGAGRRGARRGPQARRRPRWRRRAGPRPGAG